NVSNTIPDILVDTDRFEQIIINLVENAYKYAYENTPINIDVFQEEQRVVIKVTNSYDYIPQEKLNKLFDKFVRIDDKTTRTTRGTGLGLFIVKGLVEAMNGSIELASTKDNVFSVVLKLPISKD
ncbi:ATP-binding protein, partial [bacterium]|nr:ATP-binding protein [bacterium]